MAFFKILSKFQILVNALLGTNLPHAKPSFSLMKVSWFTLECYECYGSKAAFKCAKKQVHLLPCSPSSSPSLSPPFPNHAIC